MRHALTQYDLGAGAHDPRELDEPLDDVFEVGVVASRDPRQQIAAARDRERLDDLGDLRERVADLVQMALGHLDVDEGEHRVAEGGGGED